MYTARKLDLLLESASQAKGVKKSNASFEIERQKWRTKVQIHFWVRELYNQHFLGLQL